MEISLKASSSERTLLPCDLVEEILSRIPVEYLLQFHLICKQWYSVFKNKRFIYKYLDSTEERFLRVDDLMVRIIDLEAQTRINSPMPDEFPSRPDISAIIHCDGLVLLKFISTDKETELGRRKLYIWNPILGQIKYIQPRVNSGKNKTYGIGYTNVSRDDYKILRFFNGIYDPHSERRKSYGVNLEIYDLKSNSWSTTSVSLDWSRDPPCKGVSVNGNMYWKAHWNSTDTTDLACFRRDRLSLLHQFAQTKEIEVWVTNKVDEEVMVWSKYLSFASPDLPLLCANQNLADPGYFIDKNDKIRIWCEEEIYGLENEVDAYRVSVYEIGKDVIKEEEERLRSNSYDEYDYPLLSVYVPSLVPLPR